MRMEMEGKEPLVVIFGIPIITTGIVLGSMYMAREQTHIIPPPPIKVEAPKVVPKITAVLPEGSVQVTNHIPPPQVHEIVREFRPAAAPTADEPAEIRAAREEKPATKIIPVPIPVTVERKPSLRGPERTSESLEQDDYTDDADASGQLLPPPVDAPAR